MIDMQSAEDMETNMERLVALVKDKTRPDNKEAKDASAHRVRVTVKVDLENIWKDEDESILQPEVIDKKPSRMYMPGITDRSAS